MQPQDVQTQFDQYLQGLIEQKFTQKGHELDAEIITELKADIAKQLDEFIMARVIEALNDDDVLAFEQLLKEGKSEAELQTFAAEHIEDFTTFLTNVLLEFQQVYLA
jgi:hypothetical protein